MENDQFKDILKSKFSNLELKDLNDDVWDDINERLEKKRFFRFDFYKFNFYYVLFIASYGVFTTLLTISYFNNNDTVAAKELHGENTNLSNKSLFKETDHKYTDKALSGLKNSFKQTSSNNKKFIIEVENVGLGTENEFHKDSMVLPKPEIADQGFHTQNIDSISIKKNKKLVIIPKTDTIILYDTTYTHKKKKKK
jgi:hypothetical protein